MEVRPDKRISSFRGLRVYQAVFELQQVIFEESKKFPVEEKYSLTDQIRRSSRSTGANLSEGWKKRRYEANFICKLTDADAEAAETLHWLLTAYQCSYLSKSRFIQLNKECDEISSMLGKMMREPGKWTMKSNRERMED